MHAVMESPSAMCRKYVIATTLYWIVIGSGAWVIGIVTAIVSTMKFCFLCFMWCSLRCSSLSRWWNSQSHGNMDPRWDHRLIITYVLHCFRNVAYIHCIITCPCPKCCVCIVSIISTSARKQLNMHSHGVFELKYRVTNKSPTEWRPPLFCETCFQYCNNAVLCVHRNNKSIVARS